MKKLHIPGTIIPIPTEVQEEMFSEHHDERLHDAMEGGYVPWEDDLFDTEFDQERHI